jgi:hypothetical protein
MFNQVRIAGTIEDEIDLRRREDGFETARVNLRFSQAQGPILLFCVGANTRRLAKFKRGDVVKIFGRLTVSRSGACSLLVDEAHFLDPEKEWPERSAHDLGAAMHRFATHANVVGVKR